MRVGGEPNAPAASLPGKRPGTHRIGGWVDPSAGLDKRRKSYSHRDKISEIQICNRTEDLLVALNGQRSCPQQAEMAQGGSG
jgi:hypothetical protein